MNTAINGFYARVALGFARKADNDLIAFVRNVITMMTGNPKYTNPSPDLVDITAAVNTFEIAAQEAIDGGKIAIANRNAARVALLSLMRQLAAYVQGNCEDELNTLLSSGFQAVRAPSHVGVLPAPTNPRLSPGKRSGELVFRFDRVNNAANYTAQTAPSATGPWEDEDPSTSSRITIAGLTPGERIWARVCANGSAGPSEWTPPTTGIAL